MRVFIVLASIIHINNGYSTGAPDVQCVFMVPKHGYQPQTSRPFVALELFEGGPQLPQGNEDLKKAKSISSLQEIRVRLSSKSGHFKGFLLRAEEAEKEANGRSKEIQIQEHNKLGVGVWWLEENGNASQYLNCNGKPQSAITHTNMVFSRPEVEATWQPWANFSGYVVFRATIVEDFKIYWTDVMSKPLKVTKAPNALAIEMSKRKERNPRRREEGGPNKMDEDFHSKKDEKTLKVWANLFLPAAGSTEAKSSALSLSFHFPAAIYKVSFSLIFPILLFYFQRRNY